MQTFWKKYGLAYTFIAPAALGMLLVHYWPMLQGIYMSFLDLNLRTLHLYLKAPFVGLANYYEILFNTESTFRTGFVYAVRTTILYSLVVNAATLSLGLLLAHVLNRPLFLRGLWRSLLLLPWVVPSYVVGLLWGFMWLKNGVINHLLVDILHLLPEKPSWLVGPLTFWAIVLPTIWRSWPFTMITYLAALQGIPQELYEAAKVDGATPWQRFLHITWPSIRPVTAIRACLVNRLVPRGRRQKGEKDPKAVGDELQKRPHHGRPRLPLPKVGPAQPCLHPPKHPLHHPAKPVHLGVPPLPRPYPRLHPGLAPAPKPDHRPKTLPPQRLPHLFPVKPRVRQKPSPSRGKPPQGLPPKLGVRGVTSPRHPTPGQEQPPLPLPPHQGQKPRVPPDPPHLRSPTETEKLVLAPVGQPRGVHQVKGGAGSSSGISLEERWASSSRESLSSRASRSLRSRCCTA
jgi:multiple sugar transport system permease protein